MATQFYLQTSHICLCSPATKHHRPSAGTHFTVPRWAEVLSRPKWLVPYRNKVPHPLPRESNPHTVTHPGTNRAQRRLTSLIETNALLLHQTACLFFSDVYYLQFHSSSQRFFLVIQPKLEQLQKIQTDARLMASFQDDLGKPAPERLNHTGF